MALVWQPGQDGHWDPLWLRSRVCYCVAGTLTPSDVVDAETAASGLATLVRTETVAGEQWVLLRSLGSQVHRNGSPLLLDMAVLRHRDHVLLFDAATGERHRFFFSAEQPAVVEPLPAELSPVCPRCKERIEPGSAAVRCPECGVFHHQRVDRSCWSYGNVCGACRLQPTALDGSLRWSPEGI